MIVDRILFTIDNTGVMLFIGLKVLCMFCFEICTKERGGEKGGSANFKTKHAQNL